MTEDYGSNYMETLRKNDADYRANNVLTAIMLAAILAAGLSLWILAGN